MNLKKQICEFIYNPKKIMLLSLTLSIVFITVYCLWRLDIYRDVANCYAHMAREFSRSNWNEAFASNLPPMNIVLAGLLAMIGVEAYTATIIISGIFYILTIFPLYALLKRFLKPHEAAWGVLFFVLAPKIIRFSGTGLLESGRNFFLVLALLFMFRGLDTKKRTNWVYLGFAYAGLALSRGEGFAVMLAMVGIMGFLLWRQEKYRLEFSAIQRIVYPLLLTIIVTLAILAPRLYQNYQATGYPVIDSRMVGSIKAALKKKQNIIDPEVSNVIDVKKKTLLKRVGIVIGDFSRGAYEIYLVLAGLGLILVLQRKTWCYEYTVFFIVISIHLLIYFKVGSSYRYYTFALPLLMPFTIFATVQLFQWAKRYKLEKILFIGLIALFVGQIVNGLEVAFTRKDLPKKQLAAWINTNRELFTDAKYSGELRIIAWKLPEVSFWADQFSVASYGTSIDLKKEVDFDLIAVDSDDTSALEIIQSRDDVVIVPQPCTEKIMVFRKK